VEQRNKRALTIFLPLLDVTIMDKAASLTLQSTPRDEESEEKKKKKFYGKGLRRYERLRP